MMWGQVAAQFAAQWLSWTELTSLSPVPWVSREVMEEGVEETLEGGPAGLTPEARASAVPSATTLGGGGGQSND